LGISWTDDRTVGVWKGCQSSRPAAAAAAADKERFASVLASCLLLAKSFMTHGSPAASKSNIHCSIHCRLEPAFFLVGHLPQAAASAAVLAA